MFRPFVIKPVSPELPLEPLLGYLHQNKQFIGFLLPDADNHKLPYARARTCAVSASVDQSERRTWADSQWETMEHAMISSHTWEVCRRDKTFYHCIEFKLLAHRKHNISTAEKCYLWLFSRLLQIRDICKILNFALYDKQKQISKSKRSYSIPKWVNSYFHLFIQH